MKVRFKWKKSWPLLRAGRNSLTVMYRTPRMPKKIRLSRMARIIRQSSLTPPCRARGERSLVQEASARLIRKTSATRCAKTRMLESSSAWWPGLSSAVVSCTDGGLQAIRCPPGLAFDLSKQTCEWKQLVKDCNIKARPKLALPLFNTDEPLCEPGELACGDGQCLPRALFCGDGQCLP